MKSQLLDIEYDATEIVPTNLKSHPLRHSTRSLKLTCSWQATIWLFANAANALPAPSLSRGTKERSDCAEGLLRVTWTVYILACGNGSYYVGHTRDLSARLQRHQAGTGARHTAVNPPTTILYREEFATELEAIRRERQLKRWSHAKKEALITGDMDRLRILSHSRD